MFWFATTFPKCERHARALSFIHFARWTLVRRIPTTVRRQQREKLIYAHMFFESYCDGGWEEYIDAFSHSSRAG